MSSYTLLTFCFQLRFKRWMHYETEVLYMSRHPGNLHNKLGFLCCSVVLGPVTITEYKLLAEAGHVRKPLPPFSLVWFGTYISR